MKEFSRIVDAISKTTLIRDRYHIGSTDELRLLLEWLLLQKNEHLSYYKHYCF